MIDAVGPATSVQDAGRFGAQRYGLPPSGAMDRLGLAMANVVAGNPPFAAAIEIGPLGATFTARDGDIRIALAGAERVAKIGERAVAPLTSTVIADGATLTLGPARTGVFSYLAIEGGMLGEPSFGSFSVNTRAGLGTPFPRSLKAGDAIPTATATVWNSERRLPPLPSSDAPIRVVMGPQDDEFGASTEVFLNSDWTVSATSDRMGYRLEGPRVSHAYGHDIVSDGTVTGSIQVPGNGQPIVLMPDRGTTGGYPKIATVIGADLGRMSQTPTGHAFRFLAVTVQEAQAAAARFAEQIAALGGQLQNASADGLNLAALHSANVAGAAISALDAGAWQAASEGERP